MKIEIKYEIKYILENGSKNNEISTLTKVN